MYVVHEEPYWNLCVICFTFWNLYTFTVFEQLKAKMKIVLWVKTIVAWISQNNGGLLFTLTSANLQEFMRSCNSHFSLQKNCKKKQGDKIYDTTPTNSITST